MTLFAGIVAFLGLLAIFRSTVSGMVEIWSRSETYTHGFVILPISLWLIWQKRKQLAAFTPQPQMRFLLLIAVGMPVWALANLVGVLVVEQVALVGIVIVTITSLVGWQVARFLAFPLLFLLFAVPMGEDLTAPMMEFTASFTVAALELTGIPVYRDGLWFALPSGNWSVVEACSGVRYLIASITLGVMYAYITYHTLWKRLVFIAMSAIVPILANGLRAYMIVMIGHLSNMEYATGVDHLIYGWIFFGFVMFILFWIGAIWQEQELPPQFVPPARHLSGRMAGLRSIVIVGFVLAVGVATVSVTQRASNIEARMAGALSAPPGLPAWQLSEQPVDWSVLHQDTPHVIQQRYTGQTGTVQLFVVLFPRQSQGNEAINQQNAISRDLVRRTAVGSPTILVGGSSVAVNASRDILKVGDGGQEYLVWQWYRVAGLHLTNRYLGKAWEAIARIYPGRADGAWIAIATPFDALDEQASARRLGDFAAAMGDQIDAAVDSALGTDD